MKVAMRRTVLVAVICFAVALVVSVAFLVWFNTDPDKNITAILTSLPLSYLYAISSGLAAFSVGALVALVAGSLAHLRMPHLPRAIFAALGWVVLGFLLVAPVIATRASNSAAICDKGLELGCNCVCAGRVRCDQGSRCVFGVWPAAGPGLCQETRLSGSRAARVAPVGRRPPGGGSSLPPAARSITPFSIGI